MSIPAPSDEQLLALELFAHGKNILIDSVAGGGKTTFILHIARGELQRGERARKILLLTFNKRLQTDTKKRAAENNCEHLNAFTYHGFCCKHFGVTCKDDHDLADVIKQRLCPLDYEIIIIDEAQDISPNYLRLIGKIVSACANRPQMCVIGDKFQTIYEYNGSDSRFLVEFPSIFDMPFERCAFSQTFRCTIPMAVFISALIDPREQRIVSHKNGPKVKYLSCNIFEPEQLANIVCDAINKYGIDGIFILVPSSKAKPFSNLTNYISSVLRVNVYVPNNDDDAPDEEVMFGKVCMISYHQSKGLERDCAIVLSFDSSYFDYYARDNKEHDKLCNAQYVALTRARRELYVIHQATKPPLRFMSPLAKSYCETNETDDDDTEDGDGDGEISIPRGHAQPNVSVTNVIRHKSCEIIDRILSIANIFTLRESLDDISRIEIPLATLGRGGGFEEVSDITGIAIPVMVAITLGCDQSRFLQFKNTADPKKSKHIIEKYWRRGAPVTLIAAIIHAQQNGYEHRLEQIADWGWIAKSEMDRAVARVCDECVFGGSKYVFEEPIWRAFGDRVIYGVVDCIVVRDNGLSIYYEFKCVREIKYEHILQLVAYACIVFDPRLNQEFRLFNIFDGKIISFKPDREGLDKIADMLLMPNNDAILDNSEFIERARIMLADADGPSITEHRAPESGMEDVDFLCMDNPHGVSRARSTPVAVRSKKYESGMDDVDLLCERSRRLSLSANQRKESKGIVCPGETRRVTSAKDKSKIIPRTAGIAGDGYDRMHVRDLRRIGQQLKLRFGARAKKSDMISMIRKAQYQGPPL